ncbi:MAG TPA: DinB family protein [Bryobacteraceae bacterium]|jgi:hypothetical protein|nr:DinB family protein [Bryobacteraceae bacterium]
MEIHNIESFLSYFGGVRARTMRVVEAVPADKIEWRHSGVFSPGDLARHIAATECYTFAENVLGRPSLYQGCGPELADGRDAIIGIMERLHRETIAILQCLTPVAFVRLHKAREGSSQLPQLGRSRRMRLDRRRHPPRWELLHDRLHPMVEPSLSSEPPSALRPILVVENR